ncbi:adenylate/guanylate cyclase domain-containing protein [Candidatus Marinimicrobia bacterium MT.SAG.3]|nr:adenylate/guanylate cyclase domain-containing protein [Candidatus Marinimicrobia bacterium MT.SAG.3]
MTEKPKRKLAAIMFTDMVGYTALMQKDESKARELIQRHRELMKPHVEKHGGEILQFVGDGTFCTFDSAIEAVNAALEIQYVFKLEDEMSLRIGIHVGDVVVEGDEVYGDGVNVASRIEPLAEPGGICVTDKVYDNLKNQQGMKITSLGEKELKNVQDSLKIYSIEASMVEDSGKTADATPPDKAVDESKRESKTGKKKIIYMAVAALAIIFLSAWLLPIFEPGERQLEASGEIRSIAILPLDNLSNDSDQEYFSDGMTEALIANIAKIRSLKVISRTSVMRYKGTDKSLPEIAKELNVDAILEGSVLHAEGEVRITVQLIRASTDEHLWAESYTDRLENIMILQSKIARAVAKEIKLTLSPEEELRLSSNKKIIPEAHEAYLRGKHFWNKRTFDDILKALEFYKSAVEVDPTYALAYIGEAESYSLLHEYGNMPSQETYPKAVAAAKKALEIDPTLGEAHIVIAYAYYEHYWDWEKAEEEFKIGIELSPNYATGHQWYAEFLFRMRRFEEGRKEIKIARELDPLSMIIHLNEGFGYILSGDRYIGIEILQNLSKFNPESPFVQFTLYASYRVEGNDEEAFKSFFRELDLVDVSTEEIEKIKVAYETDGWRGIDLMFLERDIKERESPTDIARDYIWLKDYEKAIDWLEKGFEERDFGMTQIYSFPIYRADELLQNKRFQAILKKMNFPK